MRFMLISDFHLLMKNPMARLDKLPETQLKKLVYVLTYARRKKAVIVQAGDLCDKPRSWYLLPLLAKTFKKFEDVPIHCIFGQHDTYLYSETTREATIIGTLEQAGLLNVLSGEPTIFEGDPNVYLYGANYGTTVPPKKSEPGLHVLVVHDHISDKALFPNHRYKQAKQYLKKHRFDVVLCGDIHRKFKTTLTNSKTKKKRYIVNTGPVLRKDATKYMWSHKPGFFVYSSKQETMIWHEIPHEPAEECMTRVHLEVDDETLEGRLERLTNKLKEEIKPKTGFQENLSLVINEYNIEEEVRDIISEIIGKTK